MTPFRETVGDTTYTVTQRGNIRHWAQDGTDTTLCSQVRPRPSDQPRYPNCQECKSAMGVLRDDHRRMELAALAAQHGIDIAGVRYGVTEGGDRDHLLLPGDITTLCGLPNPYVIAAPDATPTCRRCLKLVGRTLATTDENDRLKLIADLAADILAEHADVTIHNVPGDQVERLRQQIRTAMRARKLNVTTVYNAGLVSAWSTQVYDSIPQEQHDANMRNLLPNPVKRDNSDRPAHPTAHLRTLNWRTWAD